MKAWIESALVVQARFRSLRSDPLSWIERGVQGRRVLFILLLFVLLLVQNALGKPLNPWFNIVMLAYMAYLLLLERLSRVSERYHHTSWRAIRTQSHLMVAALILAFSGTTTVSYLVYLPWVITSAIYLKPRWAALTAVEAVILASLVFWISGQVPTDRLWSEIALLAVGFAGASLFTVYLWQKLVTEWRLRVQQISTLQKVGSAITAAVGLAETFEKIFDLTRTLIPFETALILSWDSTHEFLLPRAHRGYDPDFVREKGFTFRPNEGLTGLAVGTKSPLLVLDVERDAPALPRYPEISEGKLLRSFMAVPLIFRDDLLGVFELTSDRPGVFNEKHLEILNWLADQITIAMRNAQLQQQLQNEITEAERQYKELSDLYDISVAMILQGFDVEALLKTIVGRATGLLRAHGGGVLLSYPKEEVVRMIFTHNLDAMRDFACKFGEGMAGRVAELGEPIIVDDYQAWEHRLPGLSQEPYRSLLRAVVQVPLKWKGQVIGVLAVSDNNPDRAFDQTDDLLLLERFANQAALAIGNARLNAYRQKLISISQVAIIRINEEGCIQEFNEASERILGFKEEEVLGDRISRYYYDGEREARKINRKLIDAGDQGVTGYRTYVRSRKGERIPIDFSGMLLYDEARKPIGSFGIMNDKRQEIALLDSQRKGDLLAELEHYPQDEPILSLADLRKRLIGQLTMVRDFCQAKYLILFASIMEGETVLSAIAWTDLPRRIVGQLPHYNWRKAGMQPSDGSQDDILAYEAALIAEWSLNEEQRRRMIAGIRGSNSKFFEDAACVIPLRLADNFRSVLVYGPFSDQGGIGCDADFLKSVNLIIGTGALSWLQALHLRTRQERAELAAALIIHRTKIRLQQLDGKLGLIKRLVDTDSSVFSVADEGEKLVADLSRSISKALTTNVVEMEPEDYKFQRFLLAALVQNCVEDFERRAKDKNRELYVDSSIEYLPYAEVDPTYLSIALSNLVDNALKYSFEGTYIQVSSEYDTRMAKIFVDDVGDQLPDAARASLRAPGLRWRVSTRQIPGMGLGLWEANRIAEIHGGRLNFQSVRVPQYGKEAHQVRVWLEIPLCQDYGIYGAQKEDNHGSSTKTDPLY